MALQGGFIDPLKPSLGTSGLQSGAYQSPTVYTQPVAHNQDISYNADATFYQGENTLGATSSFDAYRPYGANTAYSTSGAAYNAADLAYLNDQQARLEAQRRSADIAEQNGLTQLQDDYNRQVSSANLQRSRTLEDFGLRREDTTRAKDSAIGRVDTNARTLANSLRQRLGLASGADSSAYQFSAPGAVAREATKNRMGVMENFGTNFRDLGKAEDRANVDFETLLSDLDARRKTSESDFRAGLLGQRNSIDQNLSEVARQRALLQGGGYDQVKSAMSPYSSAIDGRQAEIDGLFSKYRTAYDTVKPVQVQTPTLKDYMVDKAAINTNNSGQSSVYSPYEQFLKRRTEEDLQA